MPNASGVLTLFLKSGIPAPSQTIPLHTYGTVAASGSAYGILPLGVAEGANSTGTNDNITLFIKQSLHPSGVMPLYLHSTGVEGTIKSNKMDLFLMQGIGATESLNLYVKGLGVTGHSQAGITDSDGFNFYSETIPLTIQREYEATTATTRLFIEGQQTRTLTGTMPLNILTPSGMPNASLNLFLNSSQPSGTLNLYTRGY